MPWKEQSEMDEKIKFIARLIEEKLVGETGFEPATLCSQSRCATRLRYSPTLVISDTYLLFGLPPTFSFATF